MKYIFPNAHILLGNITSNDFESNLKGWLKYISSDVVINNEGSGTKALTLDETKMEHLHKEFDTNCVGFLSTVKGCINALVKS